ncbi:efflux transporter outer membrane subunit [Comamonas serinivorans]
MRMNREGLQPWRLKPVVGAALTALALTGCSLAPKYERPAAPVATQWPASAGAVTASQAAAADLAWQDFVTDPQLRELIGKALHNNRDLRMAIQSIEQARAQYQITRANQLPTVGLSGSGTRQRPGSTYALGGPLVADSYSLGVGISDWEIDFFGRLQSLKDAALAQYLATEEARKAAQISLVANIASTWLTLKTDTDLLVLAERTMLTRKQSFDLTKLRFDNGVSSALDMRQAESLLSTAEAARAAQTRARALDINLLTLLVGEPIPDTLIPAVPTVEPLPASGDLTQANAAPTLPDNRAQFLPIPEGLPSDLLIRRPDIRQAEQQLIAANANIGAARAAFFPRISLTASLGRISSDFEGLFGGGSSGLKSWSFGPTISLPIFDGGRNRANLEVSQATRDIAVSSYEKAIQTAFREVADALASRSALADQAAALQRQADAERDRFRLADLRYRNGVANYLDMLDAQRSLFATEQELAQVQLARQQNEVLLYKALGGGWGPQDEAAAREAAGQPVSREATANAR